MAEVSKQRLIGALLVLAVILLSAILLIQTTNKNITDEPAQIVLPEKSNIENEVDVLAATEEVMVDPQGLGTDTVVEPNTASTVVEAVEVEKNSAVEKAKEVIAAEIKQEDKTEAVQVAEPVVKEVTSIAKQAKPAKQEKPVVKAAAVTEPKPALSNQQQWLIQVASFGVKNNAYALEKKLKRLAITSQVEGKENSQGKMIYRVKVGPQSNKDQIDATVEKIKKHLKLTPQVKKIKSS